MKKLQPKLLWNSKDSPWLPSGYGVVGKGILPRFAKQYGEENILIYAPVYQRDHVDEWQGMKVLPGQSFDFGEELIQSHWVNHKPTFLLQVGDWFPLKVIPKLAAADSLIYVGWHPYDFLKVPDSLVQNILRFAFKVVPWNSYSEAKFKGHGLTNVTAPIPLGVDTNIWTPMERKRFPNVMASLGFDEACYNILLVGANQRRKYLYEQLEGVGLFRKTNPDKPIRLYLHTHSAGDLDIHAVVRECGLEDVTVYPDQYAYALGGLTEEEMVKVFTCADVVLNVCLEGMGLAQVQAQALGVPVITLGEGPGPEIVKFGAEVGHMGVDYTYMALKPIPDPVSISQALDSIWPWRGKRDMKAVEHIRRTYSWDVIADQWFALIEQMMFERDKFSLYKPTPSLRLRRLSRQLVEVP